MNYKDYAVLLGTLIFIALYGWWKSRHQRDIKEYLLGDQSQKWWQVGFAVMATQASAITFISTTGQGFTDGLKFVQFYFGLPFAMIIISVWFIPAFYKLKVFTAYEFLEKRFDLKTRLFASIIFLIQRGLAAGITLYAPSIILSSLLDWNLQWTHVLSGILVIIYTVSGGSKAVSVTQIQQAAVIFIGMAFAMYYMISQMPEHYSIHQTLKIAGIQGKINPLDFSLKFGDRYNFWSGITGGLFVALAYFGTDQSQVQRYLTAKNPEQSKLGLLMNGLLKIPMQIFILMCGVFLFVFIQFQNIPLSYNQKVTNALQTNNIQLYEKIKAESDSLNNLRKNYLRSSSIPTKELLFQFQTLQDSIHQRVVNAVKDSHPEMETNDKDYIFLHFIVNYLPHGLIGLLIAVILCAAMSSISAELNALSGTSYVDIHHRLKPNFVLGISEVNWTKIYTILWGTIALGFAFYASLFDNLIQMINIIGSIFYGSVLGIFIVAFAFKNIKGNAVFYAALGAQIVVVICYLLTDIGFLWYNVIGVSMVIALSLILQKIKF